MRRMFITVLACTVWTGLGTVTWTFATGPNHPATFDWTKQHPTGGPNARFAPSATLSLVSGPVVCCGLDAQGGIHSDLWQWDGSQWVAITPQKSPPARYGASMAYDFNRDQLVLFGGYDGTKARGDTWTFDSGNWTKRSTSGPHGRMFASMAWDNSTGTVLLFGGQTQPTGGTFYGDTWFWDGSTWTKRAPTSSPTRRANAPISIQSTGVGVVLFSGENSKHTFRDSWTWNGNNWHKQQPASAPPYGVGQAMIPDDELGKVLLFTHDGSTSETWTWDGTNWAQLTTSNAPSPRTNFGLAFDAGFFDALLFGGDVSGTPNGETWTGS